jgi:predicted HicB family RNase H-like nuclease
MDTKLTLKLDGDIIEQAKIYAKKKNTSLSKLIESYLAYLLTQKTIKK